MFKSILVALVSAFLVTNSVDKPLVRNQPETPAAQTGTLEKMIVADGSVAMAIDLNRLSSGRSGSQPTTLSFTVQPNSFFTALAFNGELRGLEAGSMILIPQGDVNLPAPLSASYQQLVIESTAWGAAYELVVRDAKTGFVFFNIEGHQYDYAAKEHRLAVNQGTLLLGKEFAVALGRPALAGSAIGKISFTANMRPIEITQVVNGEATSSVMPPLAGTVPGPDVIVGDLSGLAQFGSSSGTQVGLAVGTDSCNAGVVPLNWFALPANDHPVIPQNLYRMSGGASNNDRFEQIGQSNVKHAFTALQQNICGFGCNATGSTTLGSGCSDPYSASLNAGTNNALGSRAWINPFTGAYPGGSGNAGPNGHTGHTHTGPSHRILVEMADLNTTLNTGATYFAEAQYVTPHEYAWCVAHPGECNMGNNASYRQYSVTGTTSFGFTAVGATVRAKSAIAAWTGASIKDFSPDPGNDGIGFVAYKVTNPSPGVWHYEYAIYNQNLDRGVQSFSVPLGPGITVSNLGFHAPPQHPGWAADGTVGNAGYSSTPWTPVQVSDSITWSSETFAQNPNANAIRWGTLYNFRFDSDRPPQTTTATIGFFKTGAPIQFQVQGPTPLALPTLSINDVSLNETNAGTTTANFTVSLSAASTDTVTVQYATADGLATAGSDYVGASGGVTFTPGQTSRPVSITVNGDGLEEPNETFFVNLTTPVNATIADSQGTGTINNDDILATLPSSFNETQINGLSSPTAMAIHPDGRVFVCQQGGALRIIKNGALLATPFTTVSTTSSGERGLLGVAFDPNYATNRLVYVYYTATTPSTHNRVSRFTAQAGNEDLAVVGSEEVLLDLNNLSGATNHNGGAIHFGPDGKLYVAVGENANSSNSQNLNNLLGKMLRLNPNPADPIPTDNPTTFPGIVGSPTGNNRAIWAVGLRNPFTFSFQPGTGRMHINDVGEGTWEEVNVGVAGSNYGWGAGCEGTCGVAGMTNPLYQYSSAGSPECAITGGAFYNPTTPTFPAQYLGKYFLADFCGGWLKTIDPLSPPATGAATGFATGISSPVDIQVANDGSLYYLARGSGSVFRVQYFGGSTLSINDVSITEGNAGTSVANFTVSLSPASAQTVTVNYTTADNTATAGSDYVAASGMVTFTPGQQTQPVSVTINGDTTTESNETFNVNLSTAVNGTISDSQGIGTITNDDAAPTISIDDVSHSEGNAGTVDYDFTVSLSNASSQTITVNAVTADSTATTADGDYTGVASTLLTFTPSTTTQHFHVTVNGDSKFEANETFFVNLSGASNATISDSQGVGTINNDDAVPAISIGDVSHSEGNSGTVDYDFTVSLSNPSSQSITVNAATGDNTATTADSDYTGVASTQLTFAANTTTQHFHVSVNGETKFEPTESFNVNLSGAVNATISDNQAVGTITNDDSQPTISINDVTVTEGNAGTIAAGFTVTLSNASSQTITVNYATADDTATAGSDFSSASGTLQFDPGQTSKPVSVTVSGDTTFETNETFNVNLSNVSASATIADGQGVGTITNDEAQPTISINDVTVTEGNGGTVTAAFTVTLSGASSQTITANYATADISAAAGSDFAAASGTVTFNPGQLTRPINVTVNGDTMFEPTETFNVTLSTPVNTTISDNTGLGTITNDDTQPTIAINDVSVNEGNTGTTTAAFSVTLSNASSQTITVNYATANGTAIAGTDYTSTSGTLTFTSGQTSQPINVSVNTDVLNEASVAFNVNLSTPANATIADSVGLGSIVDDDAPALATEPSSQRAIALDAVTFVRDPFLITNPNYFGADKRTRVALFATNLSLAPGLVVTAQAVDAQQMNRVLTVESVSTLPTFLGFTEIVVKLPDGIVSAGDLQVTITVRGKTSNSVLVGVTPP